MSGEPPERDPSPPPTAAAWGPMRIAPAWAEPAPNPRTYPSRPLRAVEAEVQRSTEQRAELEAMMDRTGQRDALVVAPLQIERTADRGAYSTITWVEGRVTVLEAADVLILFAQPISIDAPPTTTRVRWDVVARVCGAECWSTIPDLEPPRVITRRWPTADHLEILRALSLPEPPAP